jgi:hypothetical protein
MKLNYININILDRIVLNSKAPVIVLKSKFIIIIIKKQLKNDK